MNTGHRTVAGLLAIVAALLALNLIVKGTPPAHAGMRAGPVQPVVVAGAAHLDQTCLGCKDVRLYRFWSDGAVDYTFMSIGQSPCVTDTFCGTTVIIPGTCMADVDRNGDVATTDLLEVLGAWGPCE